jgi:epoxyqueuosine reductase
MILAPQIISEIVEEEGIFLFGVTPPLPIDRVKFYREWISKGYNGDMLYLEKGVEKRLNPSKIMEDVKSIISLSLNYFPGDFDEEILNDPLRGLISRYAWGWDYHRVMERKLKRVIRKLEKHLNRSLKYRIYVDTGPVLEKEIASLSGYGWIGKNTCFINEKFGSYLFLGEIFLDIELSFQSSPSVERCGSCSRCVKSCPTKAIISPRVLDARRCISYLTIENKGEIPVELRNKIGKRIFGCDICQEVCPWNNKRKLTDEKNFLPVGDPAPSLFQLIFEDEGEFREHFRGRAIRRSKRRGFMRNVAIALGNSGVDDAISPLEKLIHDHDPLVRSHSAWALGEIGGKRAKGILEKSLTVEPDEEVRREIIGALERI